MTERGTSLLTEVLGVTNQHDIPLAREQAHQTLMGTSYDKMYYRHLEDIGPDNRTRAQKEKLADMHMVTQLLLDTTVANANTLVNWISYAGMMRRYGTRRDGTANALMIGSLTPMSSRSFVCLARDEYGAGNAHIIDPEASPEKTRHGLFAYGSGLALPYRTGSMDFAHTNQLLHSLVHGSPSRKFLQEQTYGLFSEVARVLAPGGQLLMLEMAPGMDEASPTALAAQAHKFGAFINRALQHSGLTNIHARLATLYYALDAVRDPERDFSKHMGTEPGTRIEVYAQQNAHPARRK